MAHLLVGGDQIQNSMGLPASVALVFREAILFFVLGGEPSPSTGCGSCGRGRKRRGRRWSPDVVCSMSIVEMVMKDSDLLSLPYGQHAS